MHHSLLMRSAMVLGALCLATGCDGRDFSQPVRACLEPAILDHSATATTGQTSLTLHATGGVGRVWLHELALQDSDNQVRAATRIDPVFPIDSDDDEVTQPFTFVVEPRVTTNFGLTLSVVLYAERNDHDEFMSDGFMVVPAQDEACSTPF